MPVTDAYAPTYRSAEAPPQPNPFAPQQQQQQQQQNPFAPPQQQQNPFASPQQQQQAQVNSFAPPQQAQASPYGPPQPMANGYGPGVPPPPPLAAYPAPYYPPMAGYYDRPNHVATIGFICGLLGLFPFWIGFLLCIAAIVCSSFGLQQAAQLPGQRGRGLAIAGLVLGIVFIVPAGCGL
jgi:Domain of unknown function (DUF4190)